MDGSIVKMGSSVIASQTVLNSKESLKGTRGESRWDKPLNRTKVCKSCIFFGGEKKFHLYFYSN